MKPLVLILLLALPAAAQETPRFEGAGGYTFTPGPVSTDLPNSPNRHGWFGSAAYNFDDVFGAELNSTGSYGSLTGTTPGDVSVHGVMAGPRFTYREFGRFVPFGRVLAGLSHRQFGGVRDWNPAAQVGGGFTVFTTRRFGIVTGVDFRGSWRGQDWDEFEVYTGIAFRK